MKEVEPTYTSWLESLHAFPKLAEGVGQFMATFAALEALLWEMYGQILGSKGAAAMAMLGHIESFAIKLTAIENFLPFAPIDEEKRNAAQRYLGTVREINTFRNTLAHGLYLSDDNGTKVDVVAHATSTGRKPKIIPLTSDLLAGETDKIFSLRNEIRKTFFPHMSDSHRPKHVR
jgi:hypothetical protein